jgi:hypothetical protein
MAKITSKSFEPVKQTNKNTFQIKIMKSIKFIAPVAVGLVLLGSVSARAAATLVVNLTTYVQSSTTNDAGVITYTRTAVSIKNADLLAKAADALGITLPADARLAISTTSDSLNNIRVGDVLIIDARGGILWDIQEYGNASGTVEFEVDVEGKTEETQSARRSIAHSIRGLGQMNFRATKFAVQQSGIIGPKVAADTQIYVIEIHDSSCTAGYVAGRYGAQLATGSATIAGAGQILTKDGGDPIVVQPINGTISESATQIPSSTFPFLFNND